MKSLTKEIVDETNIFLKLSQLAYFDDISRVENEIKTKYAYDEVYFFDKRNHKKISNNLLKKIFFKLRSKYDLIDLQFIVAIKESKENEKGQISIIFRGSQEKEDWLTNFSLKYCTHNKFRKCVHSGFYRSFKIFRKSVKSKKDDRQIDFLADIEFINNNYELFLCGHSLGGAIATIVGCYFYDEGINKKNLSIFTFGAPPIAKKEFCDYYENSFKIFRFVNKEDPVPNITKFTKLEHIGKTILLNTKEVNFHSLKDYEKILKNL